MLKTSLKLAIFLIENNFQRAKEKVDNHIITKTRYIIPLKAGFVAELDHFENQLEGLDIVEVEFDSEEAASNFEPPEWFGENVSMDHRYKNNYLSTLEVYDEKEFLCAPAR